MRPSPPGNSSMNMNMRPPHPNQRPPPQLSSQDQQLHQRQLQPPVPAGVQGGRSPVLSPFQNSRPAQQSPPSAHPGQTSQMRPAGVSAAVVPMQRPMQPPHQQQQHLSHQQQPRPNHLQPGQQPTQFAQPGRPSVNSGSQGQLRPPVATGSPQAQPSQAMRPPPQQQQQQQGEEQGQQQEVHQPLSNGANLRPSSSHPNLVGGPALQQGNRLTPPSPSLGATRSPQIRPLHQNQQIPAGGPPQHYMSPTPPQQQQQQQQQLQQQQNQGIRTSTSQPHLSHPPGVRPPSGHHSPVQPHQTLAVRPPGPIAPQQQRPRPPQVAPTGQGHGSVTQTSPQQTAPGHSVQLDIPLFDGPLRNGASDAPDARLRQPPQQQQQHRQQVPPGVRPPLEQMRQLAQNQHQPGQTQAQRPMLSPQNLNPTQRQPQRPPAAQVQASHQQQQQPSSPLDGSPQRATKETTAQHHNNSSPPAQKGSPSGTENGEVVRLQRPSPQQQHLLPPNQRPAPPQQIPGAGAHQPQVPAGSSLQFRPPRPVHMPGSPRQTPLGTTEIKVPGATSTMPSRPPVPPVAPQQQQQQQLQQKPLHPEISPFTEPEEPLSDSNSDAFDEDDIEGGGVKAVSPKTPPTPSVIDRPPPAQSSVAGGPPSGPPRGPPKNVSNPRKLSASAGSGPVRIIPPSNNPTSPPASAFPPLGQPRPRVRPPPGNKVHTPYRPPERPSQAPVMYSQSGQPISRPFPQQGDIPPTDQSAADSIVPQGADAASSSIRPRDGGLQKRIVANDNNASKVDGPGLTLLSPPSPKLHGQKGPAILSVSGQKPSTSRVRTLKMWMIRGGIAYLGYTAVFNCPPESSGAKGLYCKTTNGLGGLVKPYVAPHYNAHLGPHVDHYVKPVVRQSHRIYMTVADPLVQGAFSAAGTVYKATVKKHVDSAKDQIISILPYPFKSKSGASTNADAVQEPHPEQEREEHPKVEKISRQPVHAEEVKDALSEAGGIDPNNEAKINDTKESITETPEIIADKGSDPTGEMKEKAADATNDHIAEEREQVVDAIPDKTADEKETAKDNASVVGSLGHEGHEQYQDAGIPVDFKEHSETKETEIEEHFADQNRAGKELEHSSVTQETNGLHDHEHSPVEQKVLSSDILDKIAEFKDSLKTVQKTTESANFERDFLQDDSQTAVTEAAHTDPVPDAAPEADVTSVEEPAATSTEEHLIISIPELSQEEPAADRSSVTAEATLEVLDKPTVDVFGIINRTTESVSTREDVKRDTHVTMVDDYASPVASAEEEASSVGNEQHEKQESTHPEGFEQQPREDVAEDQSDKDQSDKDQSDKDQSDKDQSDKEPKDNEQETVQEEGSAKDEQATTFEQQAALGSETETEALHAANVNAHDEL
ncbi:hypothetical protein BGX28_004832 [Mortierella sp. GBA30]|nr:hypothetical protein BGX28_004832 [Mortierella sp. GBA30]